MTSHAINSRSIRITAHATQIHIQHHFRKCHTLEHNDFKVKKLKRKNIQHKINKWLDSFCFEIESLKWQFNQYPLCCCCCALFARFVRIFSLFLVCVRASHSFSTNMLNASTLIALDFCVCLTLGHVSMALQIWIYAWNIVFFAAFALHRIESINWWIIIMRKDLGINDETLQKLTHTTDHTSTRVRSSKHTPVCLQIEFFFSHRKT